MSSIEFLIELALLAGAIVGLSLTSLVIQKWVNEKRDFTDEQEEPTDYKQEDVSQPFPQRNRASLVDRINTIASAIHAYNKRRDFHERARSQSEKINIFVLSATALFALLAAGGSLVSDWIFFRQLRQMQNDSRAWVGPLDVTINPPLTIGKEIHVSVQYSNTGHEPGLNFATAMSNKEFSKKEWNDGTAAKYIINFEDICFATHGMKGTRVAYPTTGFTGYTLGFRSDDQQFDSLHRVTVNKQIVDGDDYYAILGCFGYVSAGREHHSSFCYFYHANETEMAHLGACTVGSYAD